MGFKNTLAGENTRDAIEHVLGGDVIGGRFLWQSSPRPPLNPAGRWRVVNSFIDEIQAHVFDENADKRVEDFTDLKNLSFADYGLVFRRSMDSTERSFNIEQIVNFDEKMDFSDKVNTTGLCLAQNVVLRFLGCIDTKEVGDLGEDAKFNGLCSSFARDCLSFEDDEITTHVDNGQIPFSVIAQALMRLANEPELFELPDISAV